MGNCPICGHKVEEYHEVTFKEPYIHNNPFDGLHIYGAFTSPKETICFKDNFLHFAFYDANGNLVQHKLVQLGVENPTTKTATDEFWEGCNSSDSEDFEEDDYDEMDIQDDYDQMEDDYDSWFEDNNPNDSRNL